MGLAGRDPIFHAQLELERNIASNQRELAPLKDCIDNTCLHCHGAPGARQYNVDTAGQGPGDLCKTFLPPKEERRAILGSFLAGQGPQVITNCMVLTEGTDLPRTSCILHAKPTRSMATRTGTRRRACARTGASNTTRSAMTTSACWTRNCCPRPPRG